MSVEEKLNQAKGAIKEGLLKELSKVWKIWLKRTINN